MGNELGARERRLGWTIAAVLCAALLALVEITTVAGATPRKTASAAAPAGTTAGPGAAPPASSSTGAGNATSGTDTSGGAGSIGSGTSATGAASGWTPEPASFGVAQTKDVPVTMHDGRILRANVDVPTDLATGQPAPGPFPVILTETPYGKSADNQINTYLVQRGYIGVEVDVAGTGGSQGQSELFEPQEAQDSAEVIRWAAALPHASGSVGMTGTSYLAIDQLFAAAAVGPGSPLKAIFPVAASVDPYRDLFVSGGLVNMESSAGLLAIYDGTRTLTPLEERSNDPADALELSVEHLLDTIPFEGQTLADVLLKGDRLYDGTWWQQRAPGNVLDQIVRNGVAVYLVGGLYDVFQRGEPLLYSGLQNAAAGRPVGAPMTPGQAASSKYQLLFGPWNHGDQGQGLDLNLLQLQWFDQWLKGEDTGVLATSTPLHVMEPNGRRYDVAGYPVASATPARLFFGPGGQLTPSAPAASGGTDQMMFSGLSWPCSLSTEQWSAGMIPMSVCGATDQTPGALPGEVTYTTAPLAEPMTLAGPIDVTVQASATTTNTMWVVTLEDVAPDGSAVDLTGGGLLGSQRAVDPTLSWAADDGTSPGGPSWLLPYHPLTRASEQPVVRGKLTRYDIQVRPAFVTLAAGHRLRVKLSTGDFPHLTPPPLDIPNLVGGVYTVQHNAAALSWIDLPLLPAAS